MTTPGQAVFVFDTTTAALWAEDVARDAGIPVEVVPAPAGSDAKCDLALVTFDAETDRLARALERAGVAFRPWPATTPKPA